MPIRIERPDTTPLQQADMYTAPDDIVETLPDGRTIQLLAKGQSVPMTEAIAKGYVKPRKATGPSETK